MYDRAVRKLDLTVGSTPAYVGPGTYNPEEPGKYCRRADGYAPFLSMTSRDWFLSVKDQVVSAPGPGHYDPSCVPGHIQGGGNLAGKADRFKTAEDDTPGPGSYDVSKDVEYILRHKAALESGKLVTSRIKFHRKPEAPSIPSSKLAYGYEECDDGTLKKQAPPQPDPSIGPAYYCPEVKECKTSRQYRGCHFGKHTGKRGEHMVAKADGPGPGEYDPYGAIKIKPENANIHDEGPKHVSSVPRYNDALVKNTLRENIPPPGKYEIRGQFDPKPPKINIEGMEVEHPPFLTQAKRFAPIKHCGPAPGDYNDPRTSLNVLKKVTGLKRSPFGMTAVRFQNQINAKGTPGPGAYNAQEGIGSGCMRKAYMESTRKGVFGTTAQRANFYNLDMSLPGPAHYMVKEKPFQSRYTQPSSNFSSVTKRLDEPLGMIKDVPPPGSYNVQESFYKSQVTGVDRAKPRTMAANKKHNSFMFAANRFTPVNTMVTIDPNNPGPGTYDNMDGSTCQNKGGLMVCRDKRFRSHMDDLPGPGTYELSPLVNDTVLKGTFNATLNNPVAPHCPGGHAFAPNRPGFLLGV